MNANILLYGNGTNHVFKINQKHLPELVKLLKKGKPGKKNFEASHFFYKHAKDSNVSESDCDVSLDFLESPECAKAIQMFFEL